MGTNLQEYADWYKLRNKILDIKEKILYEVPVDESLVPRAFHLWYGTFHLWCGTSSRYKPSPPSDIRKERCPGYKVGFMTKY